MMFNSARVHLNNKNGRFSLTCANPDGLNTDYSCVAGNCRRGAKVNRILNGRGFMVTTRETTMPEQFENPEVTKVEEETASDASGEKRIERVAEKAAEKATKTERQYDKSHPIFSK
jgi:hypothetical protein